MITIITCFGCGKSGSLEARLEVEYRTEHCGGCGHTDRKTWVFHFCNITCMFKWATENRVEELGVPCRDCYSYDLGHPTGYAYGFKQNGPCRTCDGAMRVKQSKV